MKAMGANGLISEMRWAIDEIITDLHNRYVPAVKSFSFSFCPAQLNIGIIIGENNTWLMFRLQTIILSFDNTSALETTPQVNPDHTIHQHRLHSTS
jgi:hypothetical protein